MITRVVVCTADHQIVGILEFAHYTHDIKHALVRMLQRGHKLFFSKIP